MHMTQRGVCPLNSESDTRWHKQATLVAPNPHLPDVIYSDSTFTSCECSLGRSMGNQCVQQAPVQLHAEHFCERKPGTTSLGGLGTFDDRVNENDQPENMHFQKLINTPRTSASCATTNTEWASGNSSSRRASLTSSREDNAAPSPCSLLSNIMNTTMPQILGNGGPTQVNINLGSGSFNAIGKNQGKVGAKLFAHSSSFGDATTNIPTPPTPLKDTSSGQYNGSHGSGNNELNYLHELRPVQGPLFNTHHVDLVIVLVFVFGFLLVLAFLVMAFLVLVVRLVDASFGC